MFSSTLLMTFDCARRLPAFSFSPLDLRKEASIFRAQNLKNPSFPVAHPCLPEPVQLHHAQGACTLSSVQR